MQEALAKKIVQAAQMGERDPDRLAAIALSSVALPRCIRTMVKSM